MFQRVFEEAMLAGEKRDYQRAVSLLTRILSETDAYPQAYLYLGRSYHALGRFEKAIQVYRHFLQLKPEMSSGYFFTGRSYLALELPEKAVPYLKKALELEPEDIRILSLLGIAFLKLKRPDFALKYLEEAIRIEPSNQKLFTAYINAITVQAVKKFHEGDLLSSREMLNFVLAMGNRNILPHVYLASIEKELGNFEKALNHYNHAITLSPDDPLLKVRRLALLIHTGRTEEAAREIHFLRSSLPGFKDYSIKPEGINRYLAVQFFKQKEYAKAVYHARSVLKNNPKDTGMRVLMGEAYRILGSYSKAINHFMRAVELDKNNTGPRYGLAMILWEQGKYREMLSELYKIERIDPSDRLCAYYSILCKCKLGYPTDMTIPALQSAIREWGPDPYLFNALGEEYIKGGRFELAEKWFQKSIKLHPSHSSPYIGLIKVYSNLNKQGDALCAYKNYLKLFPADIMIRKEFIHKLVELNHYQEAIDEIIKFITLTQADKNTRKLLAYCYRKTGGFRDAAIIYKKLLKEEPENREYLTALVHCLYHSGEIKYASELLEKALSFVKPTASLLLTLGVLHYRLGEEDRALSVFRDVLTVSGENWRAYKNIGIIYKKRGVTGLADRFLTRAKRLRKTGVQG